MYLKTVGSMAEEENIKDSRNRRRRSKGSQTEDFVDDGSSTRCVCQEPLQEINKTLDQALNSLTEIKDLKAQVKEINQNFEQVKREAKETNDLVKDLTSSLEHDQKEIKDLRDEVDLLRDSLSDYQQEINSLHDSLKMEIARGVKLEGHSRQNNLRFYNIPENQTENSYQDTEAVLRSFIENHLNGGKDLATKVEIERAHRIPAVIKTASSNTKPRPIIAKFGSYKEKEKVRALAKNLRGSKYGYPKIMLVRLLR